MFYQRRLGVNLWRPKMRKKSPVHSKKFCWKQSLYSYKRTKVQNGWIVHFSLCWNLMESSFTLPKMITSKLQWSNDSTELWSIECGDTLLTKILEDTWTYCKTWFIRTTTRFIVPLEWNLQKLIRQMNKRCRKNCIHSNQRYLCGSIQSVIKSEWVHTEKLSGKDMWGIGPRKFSKSLPDILHFQ